MARDREKDRENRRRRTLRRNPAASKNQKHLPGQLCACKAGCDQPATMKGLCGPHYNQAWYAANVEGERERNRRGKLLRIFDLTLTDYIEMLAAQSGVCAICRKPETAARNGKVKHLAVDADHSTEPPRVRGLLCQQCNTSIGGLYHDPALLLAAVDYLAQPPASSRSKEHAA